MIRKTRKSGNKEVAGKNTLKKNRMLSDDYDLRIGSLKRKIKVKGDLMQTGTNWDSES